MDFEQCEIRANRLLALWSCNFEFVAEASGGPAGTYIVARTPEFAPYEPTLVNRVFPILKLTESNPAEPVDGVFHRKYLNFLVDFLRSVGWKSLAVSGVKWYSRRFERPISLYVPDPDPRSMPYTIGDVEKQGQKVLNLYDQFESHLDAKLCHKLARECMSLGVALERGRRFAEAGQIYAQAEQYFENVDLADEALKAEEARFRCAELFVKLNMGEEDITSQSDEDTSEDLALARKAMVRGNTHLRKGIEVLGSELEAGDSRLRTFTQARLQEAFSEFHWAEDAYRSHREFKDTLNFGDNWAKATYHAGLIYETVHGPNAALNFASAVDYAVKDKARYEEEWTKFCERHKNDPEFRRRWL
jgi:hypothetical protein